MLSHIWRAAREIDPSVADEQPRAGMREGDLVDRFGRAGLQGATGGTLETSVDYADFDDYWEPFAAPPVLPPAPSTPCSTMPQGDPARPRARLPAQRPVHAARAWLALGTRGVGTRSRLSATFPSGRSSGATGT